MTKFRPSLQESAASISNYRIGNWKRGPTAAGNHAWTRDRGRSEPGTTTREEPATTGTEPAAVGCVIWNYAGSGREGDAGGDRPGPEPSGQAMTGSGRGRSPGFRGRRTGGPSAEALAFVNSRRKTARAQGIGCTWRLPIRGDPGAIRSPGTGRGRRSCSPRPGKPDGLADSARP